MTVAVVSSKCDRRDRLRRAGLRARHGDEVVHGRRASPRTRQVHWFPVAGEHRLEGEQSARAQHAGTSAKKRALSATFIIIVLRPHRRQRAAAQGRDGGAAGQKRQCAARPRRAVRICAARTNSGVRSTPVTAQPNSQASARRAADAAADIEHRHAGFEPANRARSRVDAIPPPWNSSNGLRSARSRCSTSCPGGERGQDARADVRAAVMAGDRGSSMGCPSGQVVVDDSPSGSVNVLR